MAKNFSRRSQKAEVQPNMTPLIDVTFLLILFFMLSNRMVAEESVAMELPAPDQSQVTAMTGPGWLTINLIAEEAIVVPNGMAINRPTHQEWLLWIQVGSQHRFPMGDLSGLTAQLSVITPRAMLQRFAPQQSAPQPAVPLSDRKVVVRADRRLRFDQVQPVLTALTELGFGRLHFQAMLPESESSDTR